MFDFYQTLRITNLLILSPSAKDGVRSHVHTCPISFSFKSPPFLSRTGFFFFKFNRIPFTSYLQIRNDDGTNCTFIHSSIYMSQNQISDHSLLPPKCLTSFKVCLCRKLYIYICPYRLPFHCF